MVLVVGAIVPLGLIAFLTTVFLYRLERAAEQTRLLQLSHSVMSSVENSLNAITAAAQVLSLSDELERRDFAAFRKLALKTLKTVPGQSIVVTDRTGAELMDTAIPEGQPLPKVLLGESVIAAHKQVFATGEPQVSNFYVGQVLKTPSVSINVPVRAMKAVEFNLGIPVLSSYLSNLIDLKDVPTDWTIALFDASGREVARNRESEKFIERMAPPLLAPALAAKSDRFLTTVTFDGRRVLTAVSYSPLLDWSIAIGLPDRPLWSPLTIALAVLFGVIAVCLLGGMYAASRLAAGIASANEHRDRLINELNHRVKNTLVTIQSLALQTLRRAPTTGDAAEALDGRIMALSNAHNVLTQENWTGADLGAIVQRAIQPFIVDRERIDLVGPEVRLTPKISLALALVIHELATNAVKYGALSNATGRVAVVWSLSDTGVLRLEWFERGGPRVSQSCATGFGSTFIQGVIADLAGTAHQDLDPIGVHWTLEIPLTGRTARRPEHEKKPVAATTIA